MTVKIPLTNGGYAEVDYGTTRRWIQVNGQKFFPLEPDFKICNIHQQARALSRLCRYAGHLESGEFYSVAEHAVRVSRRVVQKMVESGMDEGSPSVLYCAKWGLIHDNAEGCGFVDIPRPVKHLPELAGYRELANACQAKIAVWLGLDTTEPDIVKEVDVEILGTEARQLKAPVHPDWAASTASGQLSPELPGVSLGWPPDVAERVYLDRFGKLFGPKVPR